MGTPGRNVYSKQRLKLVLVLLSLVTLPFVVGASALIYYYLKFSVMVERRLQGERFQVPSRLYARPLTLHEGQPFTQDGFLKALNGLKYEQKPSGPPGPGEFVLADKGVVFTPRPQKGAAEEPLQVIFEKDRVKEIRGQKSKKKYPKETLEPELMTYLFDESREKRRLIRYDELPDPLIKAVLAIEDRRFFSHPGLDPFRIVGAAVRNVRAESYIQGGSTITQQLVQELLPDPGEVGAPQGARGDPGLRARATRRQEGHPGALLERDLPGAGRAPSASTAWARRRGCTSTRTWATSPSPKRR